MKEMAEMRASTSINRVSHNPVSDGLEVDSDLVGTAGFWPAFHEGLSVL